MNSEIVNDHDLEWDKRLKIYSLLTDLCRIYAKDESESANIAAIDTIGQTFKASTGAIFYRNGKGEFRVCLAGTKFPISIPEKRWKDCVDSHSGNEGEASFGPWSLPALEKRLPFWISTRLYLAADEGGYVFLGRESGKWLDDDIKFLSSIRITIAPIIEIRHQRGLEEHKRKEAELLLAANESRLRDLFEGSRDMIYMVDGSDVITDINAAGPLMLGYQGKADMIGKPFSAFFQNPGDRSFFFKKILANGYIDDCEIMLAKSDGVTIFCLETAHVIKDSAGKVCELQGIVKDISERIESERDQWKMNLELADANLKLQQTQVLMVQQEKLASIGQLAAGVAHEINNPLGFLMSNHAVLEKYFLKVQAAWLEASAALSPTLAEFGEKAKLSRFFSESVSIFAESRDGFDRIARIVGNLKAFSRIDKTDAFESFDLNAGIDSTLVVVWNEIKYVADVVKKFGVLPPIKAKGSEINQVVLNIVMNAAQALGGSGGGRKGLIEIATRVDGDKVVISVKDNGPGIPKNIQNKIFDPFFTTKEPGKGTGLGLSISYDIIVNKHKGSFWVESDTGKGSTFFIALPVAGPATPETRDSDIIK